MVWILKQNRILFKQNAMIDDRMEEGLAEEEAVSSFGTPEEIADQILSEIPLSRLVRERVKPKRALKAWEIVLLVLGSPVWLPRPTTSLNAVKPRQPLLWSISTILS